MICSRHSVSKILGDLEFHDRLRWHIDHGTGRVGIFVIFSAALSFAPSLFVLDLLRAGQGVGAAAALAGGSAAMAQEFEGRARIRAFSMLGTTFGIGLAFGPIVAGVIIAQFGWRSIFLTSTVIGAIAWILGVARLRETRDPGAAGLDWPGAISFTTMLSLFTFAVVQGPELGWDSPLAIGLLLASAAALAVFIIVEMRVARPMLDISLFRFPRFVGVQFLPIATCYSYVVLLILLPLRFIGVDGLSEIEAGWLMLALSAPMIVVPSIAAASTNWFSAGTISAVGLLIAAGGVLWLGQIPHGAPFSAIAPMLIIGLGAGLPWGLMDGLSVSVVPKDRAGMASGIFNTTKVAGEGVALAIVSAALAGLSTLSLRSSMASGGSSGHQLLEVGQRLANGDVAQAKVALPAVEQISLIQSYFSGFRSLSYVLAGITALSAVIVFLFLSSEKITENDEAGDVSESTKQAA